MLIMACLLVFLSVTIVIGAFGAQMTLAPRRAAVGRLNDLRDSKPTTLGEASADGAGRPLNEAMRRPWWSRLWASTRAQHGTAVSVVGLTPDTPSATLLLHAGFRARSSLRAYQLSRGACALVLGSVPLVMSARQAMAPTSAFSLFATLMLTGYMLPRLYLRALARRRQHRLRLSLPDALDLLVVCVEAGIGLNQAIVRVSEELRGVHPMISEEFHVVNLEIRAGRTRTEALRALGDRTGVDDIISLAAMIIQTDRFGTSIAKSLRVHSDSLRVERRQRAEEAAAKTTIKLIFPLLFCIFPSLFVIILGPAALHLIKIFGDMGK